MHRAISSAPKIDKVLEETQKTPFTLRISRADMRNVRKFKLPTYDGTKSLQPHDIFNFTIATEKDRLSEEENDAVICQLLVVKPKWISTQWFAKLKPCTIDSFSDLS